MWLYSKDGKRINATEENAAEMIKHSGYTMFAPRRTDDDEDAEFKRQAQADQEEFEILEIHRLQRLQDTEASMRAAGLIVVLADQPATTIIMDENTHVVGSADRRATA